MFDWHPVTIPVLVGRKLIAIYDDGSGAVLLYRHDGGYIDAEGTDCDDNWFRLYCGQWAYLPLGFEFWCERGNEPMTLKEAA